MVFSDKINTTGSELERSNTQNQNSNIDHQISDHIIFDHCNPRFAFNHQNLHRIHPHQSNHPPIRNQYH